MKISNNKFVSLSYDLNVGETEDELELMESTTDGDPMNFIYGMDMMLESFEKQIYGLSKDDTFEFTLTPGNAYGERLEERVVELPKTIFEVDGKFDSGNVTEGKLLPMMDTEGNRLMGAVMEVKKDVVVMDFNHLLAGETLHFTGKILDVHDATAEEIAQYTSGGCGCGCGSGSGSGSGCDCDGCECD